MPKPRNNFYERLELWYATAQGRVIVFVILLGLAYVYASLAIDKGSLIDYLLTILLVGAAISDLVRLMKGARSVHTRGKTKKA